MTPLLAAAELTTLQLWYAVPLIVALAFTYGATRHEEPGPILVHSLRAACWIVGFMTAIYVAIFLLSLWL